jgi:hypothetical protein
MSAFVAALATGIVIAEAVSVLFPNTAAPAVSDIRWTNALATISTTVGGR